MTVRVLVEVHCEGWAQSKQCLAKIQTTAEITASIGDGGRIEIDFVPDMPDDWDYKTWVGYMCPEHAR